MSARGFVIALIALGSVAAHADDFGLPPDTPSTPATTAPAKAPSSVAPAATPPAPPPASSAPAETQQPAPAPTVSTSQSGFASLTQNLETQVSDLSQQVLDTKLRLMDMNDRILGGGDTSSGAKLTVWHKNELGSSYVITGIVYVLDGAPIYTKVDESGEMGAKDGFNIFDSRVLPGPHQLAVQYDLRGHGFGVFAYLDELHLTLRKSLSFNVEPGKVTRINGTIYEKGLITLQFKDRPDINFEETVTKELMRPLDASDAPGRGTTLSTSVTLGANK